MTFPAKRRFSESSGGVSSSLRERGTMKGGEVGPCMVRGNRSLKEGEFNCLGGAIRLEFQRNVLSTGPLPSAAQQAASFPIKDRKMQNTRGVVEMRYLGLKQASERQRSFSEWREGRGSSGRSKFQKTVSGAEERGRRERGHFCNF